MGKVPIRDLFLQRRRLEIIEASIPDEHGYSRWTNRKILQEIRRLTEDVYRYSLSTEEEDTQLDIEGMKWMKDFQEAQESGASETVLDLMCGELGGEEAG